MAASCLSYVTLSSFSLLTI